MKTKLPGPAASIETDSAAADSGWLRLAEYGEWPHPGGLQRLTREAASEMVAFFHSVRGRLARRFAGVPVYIGHPDDDAFAGCPGHTDTRAYAWITGLQARPDGLYILPRWSREGRRLLENAFYRFLSPRWALRRENDGALTPVRLLSVGLTNQPNIPGEAIANQTRARRERARSFIDSLTPQTEPAMLKELIKTLGLDEAAEDEASLLEAAEALLANARRADELDTHQAELREENQRLEKLTGHIQSDLENARLALANEREARIDMLLEQARREGRIAANETPRWRERLRADLQAGLEELRNPREAPALNTTSRIGNLVTANQETRQGLLDRVHARMRDTGEDFAAAWQALKRDRPGAFAAR